MAFEKFSYSRLDEVIEESGRLGLDLPFSTDTGILKRPVALGKFKAPNSLAIHPMEGSDGESDGSPGELTVRRYRRFAGSGAGLIWFEAVAVVPEGRATPRQLWMHPENVSAFSRINSMIREIASTGADGCLESAACPEPAAGAHPHGGSEPVLVMQLTHSGRFCKPEGRPASIIAYYNPYLDQRLKLGPDYPVISVDELERLEEKFENAALMARDAGFDGVDVKCCHRYLNCELLSAFNREGRYGGSFEGRTRFLLNVVDRIRSRLGSNFLVTTRLNIYDGIPYPYGWGQDREDYLKRDPSEPLKLVGLLSQRNVKVVNLTMGTPYYNPHVNRPFDTGAYVPEEHPLEGVARLIKGIGEIQLAYPDIAVVGTGFSWLRQFAPNLAAGCLEKGMLTFAGFGREAFAYPEFAKDIVEKGEMDPGKCCISCSKCSDILRACGTAGCAVRDAKVYAPIFRECCLNK